jgi:hypothetical protein
LARLAAAAESQPGLTPTGQRKLTQAEAHYQPTPKSDQKWGPQCNTCAYFMAPDQCAVIEGPVWPHGWCMQWTVLHN